MAFSRTGLYGDQNSGDTISSATADTTPNGVIGGDDLRTVSSSITTTRSVLSTTVSVGGGRFIVVRAWGNMRVPDPANVSGGHVTVMPEVQARLNCNSTQFQRLNYQVPIDSQDQGFAVGGFFNGLSSGSYTFELVCGVSGSYSTTEGIAVNGTSDAPAILLVSDEGPQF